MGCALHIGAPHAYDLLGSCFVRRPLMVEWCTGDVYTKAWQVRTVFESSVGKHRMRCTLLEGGRPACGT